MTDEQVLNRIFMISERMIVFDGLDDVFEHIVKTAVALTHAEAATIRIFNIDTGNLEIVKGYGVTEGFLSQPPVKVGEGITGQVVKNGQPFFTTDISREATCKHSELAQLEGIRSVIAVPMKTRESSIGCITVYRKTREPFENHELLLLSIFSSEAVQAVEKARLLTELKRQATFDPLTGLLNKRTFVSKLQVERDRCLRHKQNMAVMFLDLDGFKPYNDTYGHLLGDKLLHDFTSILKEHCRKIDIIGRFGGDEFVIIAPQTDATGAYTLGQKLCDAVSHYSFLTSDIGKAFKTSCSIGITTMDHSTPVSGEQLLEQADKALYLSKRNGKNQVTIWQQEEMIA